MEATSVAQSVTNDRTHLQHAAHHIYTQLGFILCGTEPNAVKIGDDYRNEDMMVLMLRQPKA